MGKGWKLGKFHHDLTTSEPWKSWFIYGELSPFMAARFRLVNYYNLPRKMGWDVLVKWGINGGQTYILIRKNLRI